MVRTLKKLFVLILSGTILAGCADAGAFIDVSYFGSVGGDLNLIFDTEGTGLLCSGSEKTLTLSQASKKVNPWTALNSGGFYVTTEGEDKMAAFGNITYRDTKLEDGEITLQTFSHLGEEKVYLGSDFDGRVWCLRGENPPVLAGEVMYRTAALPGKEERTLLMCKGKMTGGNWIGTLGGKILRDSGEGQLEEIGLVAWRLITLESGAHMSILMTRSLDKAAKWQGRFNGNLYIDK